MKDFVKYFDQFGREPSLYVQGSTKLKSNLGGIASILIGIIVVIGVFFFGQELWLKLNPITNTSTSHNRNPKETKYFQDFEMFLGIRNLSNGNQIFFDESIYKVEAYMNTYDVSSKKNVNFPINTEKCADSGFEAEHLKIFEGLGYENALCISRNQTVNQNISIAGYFGKDGYRAIFFRFKQCKNDTDYNECQPQEIIDKYLLSANLAINAIDNYVITKNYSHPFQKGFQNYFSLISLNNFLGFTLYLRDVDFSSDVGLILEDKKEMTGYRHDYMYYNRNNQKQAYFAQVLITKSSTLETYDRSYLKFQNLAAQIGGFVKFIQNAAYLLLYLYCQNDYSMYPINSFFNNPEEDDKPGTNKYQNNVKNLRERLDVKNLLRVYFEVDKLKYFTLNRRELLLFDRLDIPYESEKSESKSESSKDLYRLYMISNDKFKDYHDLEEFYSTLKENANLNNNFSSLETRLVELLM